MSKLATSPSKQAAFILDQVSQAGACADLIIDQSQSLSLSANDGELEQYEVSSTQIYGLRVVNNNRIGSAYSEANDEESLALMVKQAITNSQFSDEDNHETIVDYQHHLTTDDQILCPKDTLSIDDKITFILSLEDDLRAKQWIQSVPYNSLSNTLSYRSIYSTSGLIAQTTRQSAVAYAHALAKDGQKSVMEGHGQIARRNQDLSAKTIIQKTYDNCVAMLDGKPIPSGRYDVIFDKDNQVNLFNSFSMVISGKSAKDGINPWLDQIGQFVADQRLSLYDNPLLIEGHGYDLFDAEGTPTQRTQIIQEGKLNQLLHNNATANYFNLPSTGNATRSAQSTLSVSAHQLMIDAGNDANAVLKAGDYLLITDLTGMHSGTNAISGDFSLGASGFLCRDNQRIQPVRGVTVAGNFYKMLKQIASIGDTQHWNWNHSSLMPSIRFEQLVISGE